jgi:hypothetical protein
MGFFNFWNKTSITISELLIQFQKKVVFFADLKLLLCDLIVYDIVSNFFP